MDLSLLPTPKTDYKKQSTEARFTVRSANSPSYNLTRRQGVRRARGFLEEGRDSNQGVVDRGRHGTNTGANLTNKVDDYSVSSYQGSRGSQSNVKGQYEESKTSDPKMSIGLTQNSLADKKITEFDIDRSGKWDSVSESRGRTGWRTHMLPTRSKSLDWRTGERNRDRDKKLDTFMLSTKRWDSNKHAEGLDERTRVWEGLRGTVMSSVDPFIPAGTTNGGQEGSQVSDTSQTLNRANRGKSLPSRLRSTSGPCSIVRGTTTTPWSKGSQSISERIEQLYGSAGFGKVEDHNKSRDSSKLVLSHLKETTAGLHGTPQQRSYEWTSGGTFPRGFSSGGKHCLSPVQSTKLFTWTQNDTSETSLSPSTSRISERLLRGQTQERFPEDRGVWSRTLTDIGTRSLDRTSRRYTAAAQQRSARPSGDITTPLHSKTVLEKSRSFSWRDLSGLSERGGFGSKDQGKMTHGEKNVETNGINKVLIERAGGFMEQEGEKKSGDGTKVKPELKRSSMVEDVFESKPQIVTIQTIERKKFPEMLSVHSVDSVKNKINQFEALTQRSQGLATGQVPPRRTFSAPTQLSRAWNEVKKSSSAKAIGGLKDVCEGLKEGDEAGEKNQGKGKVGIGRSLSVDGVGLRLGSKEREWNNTPEDEGKEKDGGNISAKDFQKYSRLTTTTEIPLNGGDQRQHRTFYTDETDFSKVSSPEEARNSPVYSLPANSVDTPAGVQKTISPPVGHNDKTPTNSPTNSPFLSPSAQLETTSETERASGLTPGVKTPVHDSPLFHQHLTTSSYSSIPNLISSDVDKGRSNRKTQSTLDMNAWLAGLNTKIKVWNDEDSSEDDDESTQKDEDSNYDSDSGESSVTITSNMSQSEHRSFCVSLSDLCNFAGVDYESENDSDEWQSSNQRSASLSSDMSAMSYVSVLPTEELNKLLEDVRSLGDSNLQDYNEVQVVVLHKEVGMGLGFSVAGGVDQHKPVTVHKVFPSGVAAQEGSIKEGDQILSINGTPLSDCVHWEVLRVLRRARIRNLGVLVMRRGETSSISKNGEKTNNYGPKQTQSEETGQRVCVHLEKTGRDLGFSLEGGVGSNLENKPLKVQKVFQGGPVGKVCPGDEVVEIQGVSMTGMRRLEAWTLIRRLPPGPVDLVLRRSQLET